MAREAESAIRRRVLHATSVVLARAGHRNLQLSEVAAEAGVSRPTLYKYFGSKEGLMEAFSDYEQDSFDAGIAAAITGLRDAERLDAALRFIVEFQASYSLRDTVDREPGHVVNQLRRVLPVLTDRIRKLIPGDDADVAASAVVRIAICHYVIGDADHARFLTELRHAAGLEPCTRRTLRSAAG
jgi:AcrR family transcriptional regulator